MALDNTINIQGLTYNLPKQPAKFKIRGSRLHKSKQVWSRNTEYEQWNWDTDASLWEPDQIEWYFEELGRIYDGEWIMINGTPTYLNGMFYFFLQWFYLENSYYPEYRDTSLEYFRFIEICQKDKLCLGSVLIKGRRLGASSMEASILLRDVLIERNIRDGIVSKTDTDAEDIFKFAVDAFQNLPTFLKPQIEGNQAPKKKLSIKKQAQRVTKDSKVTGTIEGLNNELSFRATALNSYDSGKLNRILIDECAKWNKINIGQYWKIVQKCLTKGAMVVGKASFVSTVNKGDAGGDNFKTIWYDSDINNVNSLGQTSSRLFRIFISSARGYEGYIDQYGNSVVETPTPEQTEYLKSIGCPNPYIGSREYILMQRELVKHDPELLAEEIRTAPLTWEEVFSTTGTSSHFYNVDQLKEQETILLDKIIDLGRDVLKGENGRRGTFVRLPNGRVTFVDNPKGLWYIDELLTDAESNKWTKINGRKVPSNTEYGGAGFDPYAHSDNTAESGSDSCVMIRNRFDPLNPEVTGKPVAMMLGRTKRKHDLHEQVFLGVEYYGVMLLGEKSQSDWIDWARENGYEGYCVSVIRKTDGKKLIGLSPQDKDMREAHLTIMVETCLSDVFKIPFIRLVRDRISFDINNRNPFDAAIADGLALLTIKSSIIKKKVERTDVQFLRKGRVLKKLY